MKKENNSQPTPANEAVEAPTNVVTMNAPKGQRIGLMDQYEQEVSAKVADTATLYSSAKQRLAEAADLWSGGEANAAEAEQVAADAAALLYQGRIGNTISAEQVTEALGSVFGFKEKKDGTPSATPNKRGEGIRKRIVRAFNGHAFVSGANETDRFFDGLPRDDVASILNEFEDGDGDATIWTVYNDLAELKRNLTNRTNPAFDPKRVMKLVAALSEPGAPRLFAGSRALVAAYAQLRSVIRETDLAAAALVEAEAA